MRLAFLFLLITQTSLCQPPFGDWYATLKAANLPLVFHIQKDGRDKKITVDSPKQKAFGMPAHITISKNNSIQIEMPKLGLIYTGNYYPDSIAGVFQQGAIKENMTFFKEPQKQKELSRPQEPKGPFAYSIEEVRFLNPMDSIRLAGTFTYPKTKDKFPAVVLVSGSGPQDRNEEIAGHKPFWVIADYLSNLGYGVLRYDDRGTYQSEGDFNGATTFDLASDAQSAVQFLINDDRVRPDQVVVMGHSEGGTIANILGSRMPELSGIVSLAGTAIRGDSILKIQTRLIAQSKGEGGRELEIRNAYNDAIWDAAVSSKNIKDFEIELASISKGFMKKLRKEKLIKKKEQAEIKEAVKGMVLNPWMYEFIRYSPSNDIKRIKSNVLVLIGSKDIQVTSRENIEGYKNLLPKNRKLHTIKELKGLNHLFQKCSMCDINEYGQLEETFSMDVLEEIRDFLEMVWK
tara:strand:- start:111 stop:1490 length:1380 start_codon:yes stop_codon:yes gene_type:complete